jgi:hypothetical protein
VGRALPILGREGIKCQVFDPLGDTGLADRLDIGRSLLVTLEAWPSALASPAAVAIHDDGDMPGNSLGLGAHSNGNSSRNQTMMV